MYIRMLVEVLSQNLSNLSMNTTSTNIFSSSLVHGMIDDGITLLNNSKGEHMIVEL
jgi:hypothetical protein